MKAGWTRSETSSAREDFFDTCMSGEQNMAGFEAKRTRKATFGRRTRNEPVHRWLTFSDGWPPSAVERALSVLKVSPDEWVWDPFGGSGTTAVVAMNQGFCVLTSDVDPLAALVASVKVRPPARGLLEDINWPSDRSLAQLCGSVSKALPASHSERVRAMRFLIVGSVLRSGWHLGEPFHEQRVRSQFSRLRAEMLTDKCIPAMPTRRAIVHCGDFRDLLARARKVMGGRSVMVTSPPFVGSDRNPKVARLKRIIGLTERRLSTPRAAAEGVYHGMLVSIANAAMRGGCRAVAIELSARSRSSRRGTNWPPNILADALRAAGYTTDTIRFTSGREDPSVLCLGVR